MNTRSPTGFVPLSASAANPLIVTEERQITEEELDAKAAFVGLRNTLKTIDDIDHGLLDHRQTLHAACGHFRRQHIKFDAEFGLSRR